MKIYIPLWEQDVHTCPNPFIATYVDAILEVHSDVDFHYGLEFLWSKECESYDIVHFMWPHSYGNAMKNGKDFSSRVRDLKSKGVKIIATCHNLKAHNEHNKYSNEAYDIVYKNSDAIIHLGSYSLKLFQEKYPNAENVLIPHHVYDTIYPVLSSRKDSLEHLGLDDSNKYILCFGAFRNEKEKELVKYIGKNLKKKGYRVLAPSMLNLYRKNPFARLWNYYQWIKLRYNGVISSGQFVSNEDLPYYYGVSEISLIQRVEILNSGNVPLGFYMGNVVVGPDAGNVGELLKETGNPVFDPYNNDTILKAINDGISLISNGKGESNRQYALKNFPTSVISEQHYGLYKKLTE